MVKRKCRESKEGRGYEPGKRKRVKREFLGLLEENSEKIRVNWIEEKITT
jgi:hypothetical protein